MFARWWQSEFGTSVRFKAIDRDDIEKAINSRRIMVNDISTFTEDTPCMPWLMWWPLKPEFDARWDLAKRCPSMHLQVSIPAMHCDYQGLYEYLNVRPSSGLAEAADQVGNTFYREDLKRRAAELSMSDLDSECSNISAGDMHL